MIKICSLDFINKKTFETDVMAADGSVLVKTGDSVTPELLLRLYFMEIYVAQPLVEEVFNLEKSSAEPIVSVAVESLVSESALVKNELAEGEFSSASFAQSTSEEVASPVIAPSGASFAQSSSGSVEPRTSHVESAASNHMKQEVLDESSQHDNKGPRSVDFGNVENDEGKKGPRKAGPSSVDSDLDENQVDSIASKIESQKIEVPPEDPLDKQLEFDESVAKRIVQASVKIAKLLNYSANDMKELEQVAYYCNIGISKFKKRDMLKKNFRKMKLLASYEMIMKEGPVSEDIAELIKNCISPYDSASFKLNSKIPYHHVVSITSFYEDLLAQNCSKEDALTKMLQLGGNQFNVFILHKFISMMR